mmetsp:Transcript_25801/g.65450  ORF Transcript_25801/g.65450 Transcript_25801/m.65450 type:complete len:467 (-) Transcript_25801:512-1912(-)
MAAAPTAIPKAHGGMPAATTHISASYARLALRGRWLQGRHRVVQRRLVRGAQLVVGAQPRDDCRRRCHHRVDELVGLGARAVEALGVQRVEVAGARAKEREHALRERPRPAEWLLQHGAPGEDALLCRRHDRARYGGRVGGDCQLEAQARRDLADRSRHGGDAQGDGLAEADAAERRAHVDGRAHARAHEALVEEQVPVGQGNALVDVLARREHAAAPLAARARDAKLGEHGGGELHAARGQQAHALERGLGVDDGLERLDGEGGRRASVGVHARFAHNHQHRQRATARGRRARAGALDDGRIKGAQLGAGRVVADGALLDAAQVEPLLGVHLKLRRLHELPQRPEHLQVVDHNADVLTRVAHDLGQRARGRDARGELAHRRRADGDAARALGEGRHLLRRAHGDVDTPHARAALREQQVEAELGCRPVLWPNHEHALPAAERRERVDGGQARQQPAARRGALLLR